MQGCFRAKHILVGSHIQVYDGGKSNIESKSRLTGAYLFETGPIKAE